MPQIAPITLGPKTFGSPRSVKNGNAILFLDLDPINGPMGDGKLYVGEESFSSTRAKRKASVRIEVVKVAVNPATATPQAVDDAAVELILTHGKSFTESDLVALRDLIAAALVNDSYTDQVIFKRAGQY